jgi:hypothetical protein
LTQFGARKLEDGLAAWSGRAVLNITQKSLALAPTPAGLTTRLIIWFPARKPWRLFQYGNSLIHPSILIGKCQRLQLAALLRGANDAMIITITRCQFSTVFDQEAAFLIEKPG